MNGIITTNQQLELDNAVKKPRALIKITHVDGVIRLATGGNVSWNSQSWIKGGIKITSLKTGKGGIQTTRVTIFNESRIYSILAIDRKLNFAVVEIWEYYGTSPALEDPIKKFSGEVVRIPEARSFLVLDCATKGGITKRIPNFTLGGEGVNHMPYSGQKIIIGDQIYTVEIK